MRTKIEMKESLKHIYKQALRYTLVVEFLLVTLTHFDIDKASYRLMAILLIGIIQFLVLIIIGLMINGIKNRYLNIALRYLLNIPMLGFCMTTFHIDDSSFGEACMNVFNVSLVVIAYDFYRYRNNRLQRELDAINTLLDQRESEEESKENSSSFENKIITIKGNTLGDSLEVCPKDIIYIESLSNYADIWYIDEGRRCKKTLRITMKLLNEQLSEAEFLQSCHRAYIVNLNYAVSISSRSAGTYKLQLQGIDKEIPVSRMKTSEIKEYLQK